MRRAVIACGLVLGLGHPLRAQTAQPSYERVISAVTADFNDDGSLDRAVLVQSPDGEADLLVYFGQGDSKPGTPYALALNKTAVVFAGPMAGQQPSLDIGAKGALLIRSTNTAVGRDKWDETLTVVYKGKTFVVAGLSYTVHDGLDPKGGGSCSINFLTGKGLRKGRPVAQTFAPLGVADWNGDVLPKACQF